MKKILITVILILAVTASLTTGSLALFETKITVDSNMTVASKEFIFTADGDGDQYNSNVKIAPNETVELNFTYRNFSGNTVSELPERIESVLTVTAPTGSPIEPLTYEVVKLDESGNVALSYGFAAQSTGGERILKFTDFFMKESFAESKFYRLIIRWPSTDHDNDYAQSSNHITLNVTATQDIETVETIENARSVIGDARAFFNTYQSLTQAERNEIGCKWTSNDLFRRYLKETVYGGEWPTIPNDVAGGAPLKVQPYFYVVNGIVENICAFVSSIQDNDSNWNARMIFDEGEGVWYKCVKRGYNFNVINTKDVIWQEIHSDRWEVYHI